MRLATALLAMGMAVGTVWGQSPSIIDQTRQKLAGVQQQQAAASNEALAATQGQGNAPPTSANRSTSTATVSKPTTAKPAAKPAAGNATPPPQAANTKKPQVTVIPMVGPKEAARTRTGPTNVAKAPSAPPAKLAEAKAEPAPETKTTSQEATTPVGDAPEPH